MSDPLPEDPNAPTRSEGEARAPVVPPVRGTAPAWENEHGSTSPTEDQLVMEARARQALREASLRGEAAPEKPFNASGFTVERGGRNAMAETAGRIGAAMGNAQREVRRRLELVRRPGPIEFPSSSTADIAERGARMMKEIDAEVSDIRRQASRKLEDLSGQAEERLTQFRQQAREMLKRSTRRAQELSQEYPLQTIAAIAGTFFLIGVALRVRRSHRG